MLSVLRASKLRTLAAPKLPSPQVLQPQPQHQQQQCKWWSSHYGRGSAGRAPLSRLPRPTTAAPESSSTIITPPPGTRTPPHQSSPQPFGHFSSPVLPAPSFSSAPCFPSSSSYSSSFTSSLWRTNSLPKISSLRAAQIARHLSSDNSSKMSTYTTRKVAAPYTLEHRVYIEKDGVPVSAFHDIPLYANAEQTILNMVVEIPRWTNAKLEVSF